MAKIEINYIDMSENKEDMFQLIIWKYIIDYWYYNDGYKLYVIKNYDWGHPVYCIKVDVMELLDKLVEILNNLKLNEKDIKYIINILKKEIDKNKNKK